MKLLLSIAFFVSTFLLNAQDVTVTNESSQGACDGFALLDTTTVNSQYGYTWWETDSLNNLTTSIVSDWDSLPGLCAGNYALLYHDSLYNIQNTDTLHYYFTVGTDCSGLNVNLNATDESSTGACDGSVVSNVTGATGNVVYNWDTGATTANISNLCSGMYELIVTDAANCTDTAITTVQSASGGLSAYTTTVDESFDGACDGSVNVWVSAGTPPYFIEHSDGFVGAVDSSKCAGLYDAIITDNAGDTVIVSYVISSPSTTLIDTVYSDSTILDTVYSQPTENCNIDFTTIDSAFIHTIQSVGNDSILVEWVITDINGADTVTNSYYAPNFNSGVYAFELTLFCSQKNGPGIFKFHINHYVNSGSLNVVNEVKEKEISLYPNPAEDHVNIVLSNEDKANYVIYDGKGASVMNGVVTQSSSEIDVQKLEKGMYFIHVKGYRPLRLIKK